MSPPTLTIVEANRVSDAVRLLQVSLSIREFTTFDLVLNNFNAWTLECVVVVSHNTPSYLRKFVASHPDTDAVCEGSMDQAKPLEQLRFASLGIIGALVKGCRPDVLKYLMQGEIMPKCLYSIAIGSDLFQTIATFIIQSIASDKLGLSHICALPQRFHAVHCTLERMVSTDAEKPSLLLKNIIRCYLNLTNDPRARKELRTYLPNTLRDGTFFTCMEGDPKMMKSLRLLLSIVGEDV